MRDVRGTWQAFYATLVGEVGWAVGRLLHKLPSRHFLPSIVSGYQDEEEQSVAR